MGTGSYLPERRLTNDELSKMVDTSDEWIIQRTGIKERRIAAKDESTASLATAAARKALEAAGLKAEPGFVRDDYAGDAVSGDRLLRRFGPWIEQHARVRCFGRL